MADYDPRVALIVTDVQNDFADPKGSLYVNGGEEVVAVANGEVGRALGAGAMVVYTQDWHPETTPHFQKDGGIWPVHCVMGTWGAEFHPELQVAGQVVRKGSGGEDGYSGFTVRDPTTGDEQGTALEPALRARGVERVVLLGLATDYCVRATALDATAKGFAATVIREGCRAVDLEPGDGDRALDELERAGVRIE
ncbi:MAG: isochorismatase family protein [Actinobacteria bacterium]|jgi:nicotinamidase/pyrazinamidase|nr:MAG: isochorismatase family protein [Actinomycetota bacterium]